MTTPLFITHTKFGPSEPESWDTMLSWLSEYTVRVLDAETGADVSADVAAHLQDCGDVPAELAAFVDNC